MSGLDNSAKTQYSGTVWAENSENSISQYRKYSREKELRSSFLSSEMFGNLSAIQIIRTLNIFMTGQFLIVRTPRSVIIFLLFELKKNLPYGGTLYNAALWFPFLYILDHCCLKEMRC